MSQCPGVDWVEKRGAPSKAKPRTVAEVGYIGKEQGGVGCTIWDGGGTLYDEKYIAGILEFTSWDCDYLPGAKYKAAPCQR